MRDKGPAVVASVPPGLSGPLRLAPFRARRLPTSVVAGAPGDIDPSVAARLARPDALPVDDDPALHVHEYTDAGRVVRGLVGALRVEPADLAPSDPALAALLPHERVESARAERMAARMVSLRLDPAPLLLLTAPTAPAGAAGLRALLDRACAGLVPHDGLDARGVRHRVWTVTDAQHGDQLQSFVRATRVLLADGHHRYAAHAELLRRHPPGGDGRMLVMLVDADHDAPALQAIHRAVHGVEPSVLAAAWGERGHHVHGPVDLADEGARPAGPAGPEEVVLAAGQTSWRITLVGEVDTAVEEAHRVLDSLPAQVTYQYHHTAVGALDAAARDGVAMLLPPLSSAQVWEAVAAGRALPAKATSFQPKPPLGLLLRGWHDG